MGPIAVVGLGRGLRIWISAKLRRDADADHTLRTTGLALGQVNAYQWSKEADWEMSEPGN